MRKDLKKLYEGKADLRNYEVNRCLSKNENVEIHHNGEKMTLTPDDLKNKQVRVSKEMTSKFEGKSYKLISYDWNPDPVEL